MNFMNKTLSALLMTASLIGCDMQKPVLVKQPEHKNTVRTLSNRVFTGALPDRVSSGRNFLPVQIYTESLLPGNKPRDPLAFVRQDPFATVDVRRNNSGVPLPPTDQGLPSASVSTLPQYSPYGDALPAANPTTSEPAPQEIQDTQQQPMESPVAAEEYNDIFEYLRAYAAEKNKAAPPARPPVRNIYSKPTSSVEPVWLKKAPVPVAAGKMVAEPVKPVKTAAAAREKTKDTLLHGKSISIASLYFPLSEEELNIVRQVADLHRNEGGMIKIAGFISNSSHKDLSFDQKLQQSLDQAQFVSEMLQHKGVSVNAMRIQGFVERPVKLLVPGLSTPDERVEISIVK